MFVNRQRGGGLNIRTHQPLHPVNFLRRNLPSLAAVVLVLWLLAAGTAFAQACVATAHIGCGECCTELSEAPAPAEVRQDTTVPAEVPPAFGAASELHRVFGAMPRPDRTIVSGPRRPERIPILFLRLAL